MFLKQGVLDDVKNAPDKLYPSNLSSAATLFKDKYDALTLDERSILRVLKLKHHIHHFEDVPAP